MTEPAGYVSIVLHAHLPFIRHPEHPTFLEENWLFEAITDCYIPLLTVFRGLARDRVPWRLTMSITPPLAAMLSDSLLQDRYVRHIEGLIDLARREVDRTKDDPAFNRLAHMYVERFTHAHRMFNDEYGRDLLSAFALWQQKGHLEIIASAATHGYLPLLDPNFDWVKAQIDIGVEAYRRAFGRRPKGFWLPECGYAPPMDEMLAANDVRYFLTESHGLLHAVPRPRHGVYGPIYCPSSGVAAFARDIESSKQVWSATEGYPGDFDYREFYRDIGYDLDYEYVRPWLKADVRSNIGIKYYRITGPDGHGHKKPYDPDRAREKAALHAGNFMFNRELQVKHLRSLMDRPSLIVAPYDAELFGHWWFEGPQWLDFLLRKIAYDQSTFRLATPSDYLEMFPSNQVARPSPSSWGYNGYSEVWLGGSNDWIYRHLHMTGQLLLDLVRQIDWPAPVVRRALNQALRELLLAQSSDWAFIMSTDTHVPYAVKRTKEHLSNCQELCRQIAEGHVDEHRLRQLESRHNIFPWLDYTVLRQQKGAGHHPAPGA